MKAIKSHLAENKPDRVETFEKSAQAYAKKIVANFKDFEFVRYLSVCVEAPINLKQKYVGESMNPDGMVALLNYREDGVTRRLSTTCDLLRLR